MGCIRAVGLKPGPLPLRRGLSRPNPRLLARTWAKSFTPAYLCNAMCPKPLAVSGPSVWQGPLPMSLRATRYKPGATCLCCPKLSCGRHAVAGPSDGMPRLNTPRVGAAAGLRGSGRNSGRPMLPVRPGRRGRTMMCLLAKPAAKLSLLRESSPVPATPSSTRRCSALLMRAFCPKCALSIPPASLPCQALSLLALRRKAKCRTSQLMKSSLLLAASGVGALPALVACVGTTCARPWARPTATRLLPTWRMSSASLPLAPPPPSSRLTLQVLRCLPSPKEPTMFGPSLSEKRCGGLSANACAKPTKRNPGPSCPCQSVSASLSGETAVHAVRNWAHRHAGHVSKIILKVDFSNAFNTVDRGALLRQVRLHMPGLSAWAEWTYGRHSRLLFGDA